MKPGHRKLKAAVAVVAVLVAALLTLPAVARAETTITVTSTDDTSSTSTNCVLRDAITVANEGGGTLNGCTAGSDTAYIIQFASGVTGTIVLGSLLPDIESDLTIKGPTSGNIAISGNHAVGVMSIDTSGPGGHTVALSNLTIENGATDMGGGISNGDATLTVTNSTFSGNSASVDGGGIFNHGNATITVTNSTISGNSAGCGGGISNSGALTVTNSTFSGNSATGIGGGIYIASLDFNPVTLEGTILASSPSGGNCAGTVTDGGYNISDDG